MNEDQAFKAIRNAIRLENLSRDVAAKVTPELAAVFKQIRELISSLPADAIARDLEYRRMLRLIAPLFRGVNDQLYVALTEELRKEVIEQTHWAQSFLDVAELKPADAPRGLIVDPVAYRPANFAIGSGITQTQLMALVDETEVLGKRLDQLFGEGVIDKSMMKKVDRVVKAGFLTGQTNEEIARNLKMASNGALQETRAIARTAVMDMSQRAHERFWDANAVVDYEDAEGNPKQYQVIKMWEFDATFDYRVCPQCYPYDGKRSKERSNLPSVPRHPNCRCRILPLTAAALELEKEEMAEGMTMSTVQIGSDKGTGRGPVRRYKTKAKVNGKMMPKFAKDYEVPRGERPTMALFLRRANNETRRAVLGAENAKRFSKFMEDDKMDEVEALQQIIRNPSRRRK